jgi:hypothetical protein
MMFRTVLAVLTFSVLASASTITYTTPTGSVNGNLQPVSATTTITTGSGTIGVTLTDLTASTLDAGQLLSDLFFTLSTAPTTVLNGTTTPTSAPLIDIAANGSVTTNTGAIASWGLTSSGATIHLDSLAGGATQTIIGPGPYTASNGSIDGNTGHNPFINQTATFSFAVSGVTANTTVTAASFSWGTAGSTDTVTGVCTAGVGPSCNSSTVPEPITSGLVGTGLMALFFLRRRVRG